MAKSRRNFWICLIFGLLIQSNNLQADNSFPLEVTPEVAEELDFYLGTTAGRNHFRQSLKQMERYEEIFVQKLAKYEIPDALLAIGIIESGFRNLTPKQSHNLSAGIWQMIPATARKFGLVVNGKQDDRLDVERATDGAFKYLKRLYGIFKDWRLVLLAYNAGDMKIKRGINKAGTRDPWQLNRLGHRGAKKYLARVMAAAILMKNPQMLESSTSASLEPKSSVNQL
jgi:membrane-bound lytic murein transglycosylase D